MAKATKLTTGLSVPKDEKGIDPAIDAKRQDDTKPAASPEAPVTDASKQAEEKPETVDYSKKETFIWNGPPQGVELTEKESDKVVFTDGLFPGKTYEMPVNHGLVISWKTSGLITPAEPVSE